MRPGGGRSKGNAFERQVAKMIIEAFKHKGITDKDCYRTPLSGGHRTASKTDPGDLVMSPKLRKLFPYCVECKSYRSLPWHELMKRPYPTKGTFIKWWTQVRKASWHQGLNPLLIFKQNGSGVFVMHMGGTCGVRPYIATRVDGNKVIVRTFDEFMDGEQDGN